MEWEITYKFPQGQKFVAGTGLSSQLRARTLSAAVTTDCPDFEFKNYCKSGNTKRKLFLACLRLPGFNILPTQLKKGQSGQQDRGNAMPKIIQRLSSYSCPTEFLPQNSNLKPFPPHLHHVFTELCSTGTHSGASENAETDQSFFSANRKLFMDTQILLSEAVQEGFQCPQLGGLVRKQDPPLICELQICM